MLIRGSFLSAVLLLSACGAGGEDAQTARMESGVLYRNDGAEINTIDPHLAGGAWNFTVNGDMFFGLYTTLYPFQESQPRFFNNLC